MALEQCTVFWFLNSQYKTKENCQKIIFFLLQGADTSLQKAMPSAHTQYLNLLNLFFGLLAFTPETGKRFH